MYGPFIFSWASACRLRLARNIGLALFLSGAASGLGTPDPPVGPGSADGSFSIDGKRVVLKHAYAMTQPNPFDEKKTDTVILLTEKPLPEGALEGLKGELSDAARDLENFVLFKLDEKGQPVGEIVRHGSLGDKRLQMSGMTHAGFQSQALTSQRVAGSFATKQEEDFVGHKYTIRVRFDAAVRAPRPEDPLPDAKTGRKLPADGGEPGKAYMVLDKAIRAKDVAAIRRLKPVEVKDVSDKDLRDMLDLMAAMSPANVKIVEGYEKGDTAVLYLRGVDAGKTHYGTVRMTKSGGVWQVEDQKWSDKSPGR